MRYHGDGKAKDERRRRAGGRLGAQAGCRGAGSLHHARCGQHLGLELQQLTHEAEIGGDDTAALLDELKGFVQPNTLLLHQVANRISACLADISVWMTDHHLKLNLGKTELLFLPGKDCPFHDLAITVDNSIVSSSQSAKNLGVILDSTLSFSTNIKAVTRSCRFMLYNIRRVRPCLTQEAAQVLIQALVISRLDYCNSLLAGLPACAIKPLQLIQNAAARLVFNLPKFSHVTPLLRSLHWLPVEARIRYKTMVLAYGAIAPRREAAWEHLHLRKVFNKARPTSLPPHQPYDCRIDLLPRTTPPRG
ncbi:uncharacterized protein ACWYII_038389 [Salvelinus alpinus]